MSSNTRDKAGRFQKGKSGNPKGKPKGLLPFDTLFREILDSYEASICIKYSVDGELKEKVVSVSCDKDSSFLKAAAFVQLRKAIVDEDLKALEFLVTRAYGKPKEVAIDENLIDAKSIPILNMSKKETDIHLKRINESY